MPNFFFFPLTIGQHICNPSLYTSLLQLSKYFVYKSHWGVKTIKLPTRSCGHMDFRTLKHTSRLRNDPNTYWKEERGTNDHKASLKTVRKCSLYNMQTFILSLWCWWWWRLHWVQPVLCSSSLKTGLWTYVSEPGQQRQQHNIIKY